MSVARNISSKDSGSSGAAGGKPVALVTGGNRGIGFETCRQLGKKGFKVLLGARNAASGEASAARLRGEGLDVEFQPLDVTDAASVTSCVRAVGDRQGRLDALVNNAGIFLDSADDRAEGTTPASLSGEIENTLQRVRATLETNTLGPLRLILSFAPLLQETARRHGGARVVNLSSGMGQLSEMNGGWPAYRISKTALNAVTRILSDELTGSGVTVNSVCPGWVRTDMGGPEAEREPEQGADTVVWLASGEARRASGGFYRDRERIEW